MVYRAVFSISNGQPFSRTIDDFFLSGFKNQFLLQLVFFFFFLALSDILFYSSDFLKNLLFSKVFIVIVELTTSINYYSTSVANIGRTDKPQHSKFLHFTPRMLVAKMVYLLFNLRQPVCVQNPSRIIGLIFNRSPKYLHSS